MPSSSLPFSLGLAGIGAVLIAAGVTGNSLSEILQGNFKKSAATPTTTPTTTSDTTTGPPPATTGTTAANVAQGTAPTAPGVNPTQFSSTIPTYPQYNNKSLTWLLANGYTKNASGQVVSAK
jgi:hypothetical protein